MTYREGKMTTENGGGGGGNDDGSGGGGDNVKVVVRVRPFSEKERSADHTNIVHVDVLSGAVRLAQPGGHQPTRRDAPDKNFAFDAVFGADATQVRHHSL